MYSKQQQNACIIQLSQYVGGLTTDTNKSISLCDMYNWLGDGTIEDRNLLINMWVHKAIVRENGFVSIFINGKKYPIRNNTVDLSNLKYAVIGNYYDNNYAWNGFIDSVRVSNYAVYVKDFIPREFIDYKKLYITEDKKVYRMR